MSINFNVGSGKIAGGAGKAAAGGCGSIFGVFFGLLLVPLGFYLVYYGEVRLVNHGKVFDSVQMMSTDQAAQTQELVKITGTPDGQFLSVEHYNSPALYYRITVEEYQEEKDSDDKVSYDWNTVGGGDQAWANFKIGSIQVRPKGANPVGEETVWTGYKPRGMSSFEEGGGSGRSAQVGDQKKTIEVLDARKPVIVLGDMASDGISGGRSFVVSTLAETATSQALHTEYKVAYWLMKGGAVLAIGIGILMIFGPLTTLVGYVPLVGNQLTGLFGVFAFFFAIVAVGLVTLFIKAFWILVVLAAIGIVVLVIAGVVTPRRRGGAAAAMPAAGPAMPVAGPAMPATPTQPQPAPLQPQPAAQPEAGKCPGCGADVKPGAKFCPSCGTRLGQ